MQVRQSLFKRSLAGWLARFSKTLEVFTGTLIADLRQALSMTMRKHTLEAAARNGAEAGWHVGLTKP